MADQAPTGDVPSLASVQPPVSSSSKTDTETKKLKTVRATRPRGKTVRPDDSAKKLRTSPASHRSLDAIVEDAEPSASSRPPSSTPQLAVPDTKAAGDGTPNVGASSKPSLSPPDEPAMKSAASTAPSSPGLHKLDTSHSSSVAEDFDLEELCRKKGLKRVFAVFNDDDNAESEVERMPEKLFTRNVMVKVFDQCRKIVSSLDKLQRHFGLIKDKLYRARCLGMDQGIEAVQKGESPFLEQHMLKINRTCEEELKKAKDLLSVRIDSINLEYDSAVKALWESIETEVERKQRLRKVRLVENMIQHESDFMQTQLRHLCTQLKNQLKNGGPVTTVFNGVLLNTGTEVSIEESVADVWKIMKTSIRQKYWNRYLSPEAEALTEDKERTARRKLIHNVLVNQQAETTSGEAKALKRSAGPINENSSKRKKVVNSRNKDSGQSKADNEVSTGIAAEGFQVHPVPEVDVHPGGPSSTAERDATSERSN
ncbi:uncharacterized protein LOC129583846 [Paramacrobiotus metropolitanus]|uniref:uncharacterized protein LOC129583846 n=1 Tax=Paramacrobiotus metropolitanus TaxID=2943436 RepID=UPI002445940F|nr:uncharacterized protein LOC129583846 [Paramacrobiotus metropolitanus]